MQYLEFVEKLNKLCLLCGFVVKKEAREAYHDALKYQSDEAILKGMKLMTEDPPAKLTLKALKSFINQTKVGEVQADWDGRECEECNEGLIWEKRGSNNYVFRCNKCQSYHVKSYPYHTQEEVFNLDMRLKNNRFINDEARKN